MELEEILNSGDLEAYVCGALTRQESIAIAKLIKQHPERGKAKKYLSDASYRDRFRHSVMVAPLVAGGAFIPVPLLIWVLLQYGASVDTVQRSRTDPAGCLHHIPDPYKRRSRHRRVDVPPPRPPKQVRGDDQENARKQEGEEVPEKFAH